MCERHCGEKGREVRERDDEVYEREEMQGGEGRRGEERGREERMRRGEERGRERESSR